MAKRIEIEGKFFRMRRGKFVEIPEDWVGQVTFKQTQRKRSRAAQLSRSGGRSRRPWVSKKMRSVELELPAKVVIEEDLSRG